MRIGVLVGTMMAVALVGLGMLVGSTVGTGGAAAQTPGTSGPTPQTAKTAITQQQAEQAALAASPGNTIDHTRLDNGNGTAFWDVDFTNGGGVTVDAQTGKVIATEAAGTDKGGHMGGADQQALAAKATVTKDQAEKTALTASPGNTVDHSRLAGDPNGTVFWDVDFTNGGGVTVDAQTGAVIATEAAGTDHGGRPGGPGGRGGPGAPPTNQP
jgi:uncharacterized membrane protein YkoI